MHTHNTCVYTHIHYFAQDTFTHLRKAKDKEAASWLHAIDEKCDKDAILAIVGNKVDMECSCKVDSSIE